MKWVLIVAGAALATVLMFVIWNRTLDRRIKERTVALEESDERFRATFEQAAVGIAHVSLEGRFLRVNQRLCDILGYTHQEMSQLTFRDVTLPADLDGDVEQVDRLLSGDRDTYTREKKYLRKDRQTTWALVTASLVRDQAGQPRWFVAVVSDINQRMQAQLDLQQLRDYTDHLIQTANVMIISLDKGAARYRKFRRLLRSLSAVVPA